MPYVKEDDREMLRPRSAARPLSPGELNYQITSLCWKYFTGGTRDYSRLNEVIGALECAKLEWYRRVAAPYEDEAKKRNGEVYE